jgi:hypothetical protein
MFLHCVAKLNNNFFRFLGVLVYLGVTNEEFER